MHRIAFVLLLAACGSGGDAKPVPFTHASPAFTIDLPAGFTAQPERDDVGGGKVIDFRGSSAALGLSISWKPANGATAKSERDDSEQMSSGKVTAKGDSPGGTAWIETDYLNGSSESYLVVGDTMVECQGSAGGRHSGAEAVVAACRTLRATP